MNDRRLSWIRNAWRLARIYLLWVFLAVLGALVAFQLHATIIFFSLKMVENPATRPAGWSSDTIYGLSRLLVLILGALWLVGVLLLESFLSRAEQEGRLLRRSLWLVLSLVLIYAATYLLQLLTA